MRTVPEHLRLRRLAHFFTTFIIRRRVYGCIHMHLQQILHVPVQMCYDRNEAAS